MKSFNTRYTFTQLADRVGNYTKANVFSKFSKLAQTTQSTNLGQGFPDYAVAPFVRQNIIQQTANNQLSALPAQGSPKLIKSFRSFMQPFMQYKIESDSQVAISHGATGCLKSTIQALINPGDEVVIIDPSFDIYRPMVEFCGGKCRGVHLRPKKVNTKDEMRQRSPTFEYQRDDDDWELDWKELSEALNHRTKAIILNTPQNPTGKIFTREEINELAKVLDKHPNVWVVSDEAYSHICFPPHSTFQHPRALDHPKLLNRTVSIFSIGKIFSCSGLRIGACVGNQKLIEAITAANHQELSFANAPYQEGAALSFDACAGDDYFAHKSAEYHQKAKDMVRMLTESDMNLGVWMPEGGYFVVSDISLVEVPSKYLQDPDTGETVGKDSAFVYWLADTRKIVGIPLLTFYAAGQQNQQYVRWAFCKDESTLAQARQRLLQ